MPHDHKGPRPDLAYRECLAASCGTMKTVGAGFKRRLSLRTQKGIL